MMARPFILSAHSIVVGKPETQKESKWMNGEIWIVSTLLKWYAFIDHYNMCACVWIICCSLFF